MSFRRAKPSSTSPSGAGDYAEPRKAAGVKPWINGSYLVSTGNRNLDDLIGGGQGLGTALMMETDSFSNYGESLLSYGVAQALSSGHKVLVLSDSSLTAQNIALALPYNQNVGTISKVTNGQEQLLKTVSTDESDGEIKEGPPSDGKTSDSEDKTGRADKGESGSGLKIAWQYEKYVMKGT